MKKINYEDLITKSLQTLESIMLHSDNEKLQLEAASKILSTVARNKQFIEDQENTQLTLDFANKIRKELYGLEESEEN